MRGIGWWDVLAVYISAYVGLGRRPRIDALVG